MILLKKSFAYLLFGFLISFALERGLFILFLEEFDFSNTQISILQVSFFVSCFLAEVPTGMISDYFGKKLAAALGSLCMGLGVFLTYIFKDSFVLMFIAFIIHAIAFAFVSGAVTALLYDELKTHKLEDKYGFILSIYNFVQSLSLSIAMFIAGDVQARYSWENLYYISAIVQALSIAPVLFMKELTNKHKSKDEFLGGIFDNFRSLFPIVAPISLVHAAMTPYFVFSQSLFKSFDLSFKQVSMILSSVEFVSALIVILASMLATQFTRFKLRALSLGFACLLFLQFWTKNTMEWLILSILLFVVCSTIVMYIIMISDSYYQSRVENSGQRASIMSFAAFLDTAAIGLGYLFFGLMMDHFPTHIALAASCVFPLGTFFLISRGKSYASI